MKNLLFGKAMAELGLLKKRLAVGEENGRAGREVLEEKLVWIQNSFGVLDKLRDAYPLSDPEVSVNYFKLVYPEFKALQLYSLERYALGAIIPGLREKTLRKFYLEELAAIDRFFDRYPFHYGYYGLKAVELDGLFFGISGGTGSALLPVLPFDVPVGVPAMSYLFAQFTAFVRLRVDLLGFLKGIDRAPILSGSLVTAQGKLRRPLQWTGEKVHLIELAHGLHLKRMVNDGETGVIEFFEALGEFFGVNLGVPKSGFDDLKSRKRLSRTHFLDQLREVLLAKMEEEDSWVPGSRKGGF